MTKRTTAAFTGVALLAAAPAVLAQHPPGATLTTGAGIHPQTIYSATNNPAAGAAAERRGFRAGLFAIGFGYELSGLENFVDDFEDLSDDLDDLVEHFEGLEDELESSLGNVADTALDEYDQSDLDDLIEDLETSLTDAVEEGIGGTAGIVMGMEDDLNEMLHRLAGDRDPEKDMDGGYLVGTFAAQAPLMPMVADYGFLGGALMVDAGASLRGRLGVLFDKDNDPLATAIGKLSSDDWDWECEVDEDEVEKRLVPRCTGGDDITIEEVDGELVILENGEELDLTDIDFPSTAGAVIEAAMVTRVGVGYSARSYQGRDGALYVGGRLNHYDVRLGRTAIGFEDDADDSIADHYDENEHQSSDIGIDLGVIWRARNFMAGATLRNVNEPSFDYAAIPEECSADDGACEVLRAHAHDYGNIDPNATWTMERQLNIEGALYTANRRWVLAFSHDVDEVAGALDSPRYDDGQQWTTVSLAYASRSYFLPGFRLGYRVNNAGSELEYYTGGLTLFRHLTLDAAVSTDEVTADDSSVPRSVMVNLGLELRY